VAVRASRPVSPGPAAGAGGDTRALSGRPRAHVRRLRRHPADQARGHPRRARRRRRLRGHQPAGVPARQRDRPVDQDGPAGVRADGRAGAHRAPADGEPGLPHAARARAQAAAGNDGGRDARPAADAAAAGRPGGRNSRIGYPAGSSSSCWRCRCPTADSSRIGWKSGIPCRAPRPSRRRRSRTSPAIWPRRSTAAGKTPATT